MPRRLLLFIAVAASLATPVLADPPPNPAIERANQRKAEAEARKAQYETEKAEWDARMAPLQRFAGDGASHLESGGGAMETAYLSSVSMRGVAAELDRRVMQALSGARAEADGIIVVSDADTPSFDRVAAFEAESRGIIHAYNDALGQDRGSNCDPLPASGIRDASPILPAIGAIVSVLQSETHVSGIDQLGDEEMLIAALADVAPNRYVQHGGLLAPRLDASAMARDPTFVAIESIRRCEARARALVAPASRLGAPAKARLNSLLERSTTFSDHLTTAGGDGMVPLAAILRQSRLLNDTSRYILRVKVERAGGTLITRRNLWTALGAPAIVTSGGVIASYRLVDRRSGRLFSGGTVICRTGLTGLRAALDLRPRDVLCADQARAQDQARQGSHPQSGTRALGYDPRVFRPLE